LERTDEAHAVKIDGAGRTSLFITANAAHGG
jgi:hypothetical protein